MTNYDTVTEAVQDLKARGYSIDFNIAFDKLICSTDSICLNPNEFEIAEVYRFEGDSNPSDEDVVYAVKSKDGSHKGIITSAFGLYADPLSNDMIQKLSMHTR
ncbi:MAG: phosphoribosylpyrophosphate synthetase [Ginsengibacter sp.]